MYIESDEHFILGRGHESDVRISDISVSRSHAKITFKDKQFLLEDTGSKFGTLVLSKEAVSITETPVILQIGRTLLSVAEHKGDLPSINKSEKTYSNNELKNKSKQIFKFVFNLDVDILNVDKFNLDFKEEIGEVKNDHIEENLFKKNEDEDSGEEI
jgi:pSer/pThr/pTyr-binding forkhead associated (FHA) protein